MDSKTRFKLKKFVHELAQYRGRHTELVTVYVPQGYDLNKITNLVFQEQGTAANIKSASTRKNVISALEKILQHLKLYKQTPPNGLGVFCGNISPDEGTTDLRVWSVEPPNPINVRIYRCDKEFVLDPLLEQVEHKETYGLVVMDRREATLALLKGKTIVPIISTHSNVPGKYKAGGQSAARFGRIRENMAYDFYKRVADYMKEQFLPIVGDIKGIIIGGPGPSKNEMYDSDYITDQVKKKVIAIKDITYTDSFGLTELVDKSQDVLAGEEIGDEKAAMQKFFNLLNKKPLMAAYGPTDVKKKLALGAVDTLLVSEEYGDKETEELEGLAAQYNTEIKIISTETREGQQLRDIGKVAAILRYEIE